MPRWLLTLCTTAALFGAFRVYVTVMASFIRPAGPEAIPTVVEEDSARPTTSHVAGAAARNYLPDSRWAENAQIRWQRGEQAFLYTNSYEVLNDEQKNKVRFAPFALIWKDPKHPETQPFVLSAGSARVTFQNKINSVQLTGDPGRIIGAALDGPVSIRGPDGLSVEGTGFTFSEEALNLYSDEQLTFAYGPSAKSPSRVSGSARGISIRLTAGTSELLGDDLPRIADFEHLTLYRDVQFDAIYDQNGEKSPVSIHSEGPFDFDRVRRMASFGKNVQVIHTGEADSKHPGTDELLCDRLELYFEEEGETQQLAEQGSPATGVITASSSRLDDSWEKRRNAISHLRFHYLRAFAAPAQPGIPATKASFRSESNDLTAKMNELQFDAFRRNLTILDPVEADIEHGPTTLYVRNLLVGFDEAQQLSVAFCNGPGRIEQRDVETGEMALEAGWSRRLEFHPDDSTSGNADGPERLVDLTGDVEVAVGEHAGLQTDRLRLWIPEESFRQLQESDGKPAEKGLPVRRIHAEGHVRFAGSGAIGMAQQLMVTLVEGVPPLFADPNVSRPISRKDGERRAPDQGPEEPPWEVRADTVAAEVVVNAQTLESAPTQVVADGRVRIERAAIQESPTAKAADAVLIQGRHLTLTNEGGPRQVINLLGTENPKGRSGEPAKFESGGTKLEGKQIEVNREKSTVVVKGHPVLRFPVDSDLLGRSIQQSLLMTIECGESLTFDGSRATFLNRVRVSLDESRLHCEQLVATLDQPIDISSAGEMPRPEIRDIDCSAPVHVLMHDFENNEIVRRMEGDLGHFNINLKSGVFQGQGPGRIEEWRRGGMHVSLTPPPKAAANQRASTDELPWAYTNLAFEGTFEGNLHQSYGQINERVEVVYAPVEKVNQKFTRQDLSKDTPSAERAAWMGCRTLKILLTESKDSAQPFLMTLQAEDGAHLEGQTVHANAFQISFDQGKDALNLRGRGTEKASVYFDTDSDGAFDRHSFEGQTIEVRPSTRAVVVDGAGTLQ